MRSKSTGDTRPIDETGRVCVPAHIREQVGLKESDKVIFSIEGGRVVMTPERPIDVFTSETGQDMITYCGKSISRSTLYKLMEIAKVK